MHAFNWKSVKPENNTQNEPIFCMYKFFVYCFSIHSNIITLTKTEKYKDELEEAAIILFYQLKKKEEEEEAAKK